MRGWTLGISIVFHLVVIGGVIVAPLVATDVLPTPPHAVESIRVVATLPAPPAVRTTRRSPAPSNAAPLDAHDRIINEPTIERDAPDAGIDLGFGVPTSDGGTGVVPVGIVAGDPLPEPPQPPTPAAPVRIGGQVRPPARLVYVAPKYPPLALSSRVHGLVILEAVIAADGAVQDVRVLKSDHALLDPAATEAVRQWRFTPTLLNGQPVPVVMTVTVSFTLP